MYEVRMQFAVDEEKAKQIINKHMIEIQKEIKGLIKVGEPLASFTPTLQEHCKANHLWAAKSENDGEWATYRDKPKVCVTKDSLLYWGSEQGVFEREGSLVKFSKPTVDWNKSLIAPDGRLILIEGEKKKEPKKVVFKEGKYYKRKNGEDIIHCKKVGIVHEDGSVRIQGSINYAPSYNVWFSDSLNPSEWYEMKKYKPEKRKWVPKRGEAIFVWSNDTPDTIPAHVEYFHSFYGGRKKARKGVYDFSYTHYGKIGLCWPNWRKYDPTLVGVPRKDWPKEE